MHRFVDKEVFTLTNNDVTAISPLGVAVSNRYQFILKAKT